MKKADLRLKASGLRLYRIPEILGDFLLLVLMAGLLLGMLAVIVDAQQKPEPSILKPQDSSLEITEVERLKYENLVTRLQLVRLQKDSLAEQYRRLLDEEKKLQEEIPTLLQEILKAHGHPQGSLDWDKRRVVPRPLESPPKPADKPAGSGRGPGAAGAGPKSQAEERKQ